jgi:hypothetical protein
MATGDVIVQAFVKGIEFGVFYYRFPRQPRGAIFSVTDKRLPTLTGDGKSSLEELILKDDRAVCLAPLHFKAQRQHLFDIPAQHQRIRLVEVGTHARGAIFLDGSHLITTALTDTIDAISRRFKGFYFGRYDLRVPSVEDFRKGRHLTILELNGVTSEATHIYDPRWSLVKAYRDLFRQWEIACDIGAQNAQEGCQTISLKGFHKMLTKRGNP